jgi:hypothetical protein
VKQTTTLRQALDSPAIFGTELAGDSWLPWRSILLASMGEKLTPAELELFTSLTGRTEAPTQRVDELWGVVGRRGGKSKAMSCLAIYLAALCDYRDVLSAGEKGKVLCISPDREQSKVTLEYASGVMEASPILRQLIANRTAETLELTNGIRTERPLYSPRADTPRADTPKADISPKLR